MIKQQIVCSDAILNAFIQTGIYIKESSRSCAEHFIENSSKLSEKSLNILRSYSDFTKLSSVQASNLFEELRVISTL